MNRALGRADGALRSFCDERLALDIDFSRFDCGAVAPDLLEQARRTWQQRVQTEFRSIQIMVRFLSDVLAAGDLLDVYVLASDFVQDEIRHVALCSRVVETLGARPFLPEPPEIEEKPQFLRLGAAQRALSIAIAMLGVNETLSVGYIGDLRARCGDPVMRSVLESISADEEMHQGLGWEFVGTALGRFPIASLPDWRRVVTEALEPHRLQAERILGAIPVHRRNLEAFPEPELAALGMLSPERQALVFHATLDASLVPRLLKLGLLDSPQ